MFKLICFLLLVFVIHTPMAAAATLAEGVNALEQKRYSEALEIFVPLANAGDSEAQRRLGEMAYNGQGVKKNFDAASKWNELAAAGGDRVAMYNLGYLYERGEGVAKNLDTAIDWYQKSGNQNYAEALPIPCLGYGVTGKKCRTWRLMFGKCGPPAFKPC